MVWTLRFYKVCSKKYFNWKSCGGEGEVNFTGFFSWGGGGGKFYDCPIIKYNVYALKESSLEPIRGISLVGVLSFTFYYYDFFNRLCDLLPLLCGVGRIFPLFFLGCWCNRLSLLVRNPLSKNWTGTPLQKMAFHDFFGLCNNGDLVTRQAPAFISSFRVFW